MLGKRQTTITALKKLNYICQVLMQESLMKKLTGCNINESVSEWLPVVFQDPSTLIVFGIIEQSKPNMNLRTDSTDRDTRDFFFYCSLLRQFH